LIPGVARLAALVGIPVSDRPIPGEVAIVVTVGSRTSIVLYGPDGPIGRPIVGTVGSLRATIGIALDVLRAIPPGYWRPPQ
jgi:hypothetical protein